MQIKVPKKITKEIEQICREINPDTQPLYIAVDCNVAVSEQEDCFVNVARKIMQDGGDFQFGWAIWEWPMVMLEAEFWAVWVHDDGTMLDITPRGRGEKILFIPDDKTKLTGKPVDSIIKALIDHPLVLQYIEVNRLIWQKTDALTEAGKSDLEICDEVSPLIDQKDALEIEIEEKITGGVGRNDLCTCGSGKKFKKCCGH